MFNENILQFKKLKHNVYINELTIKFQKIINYVSLRDML